MNGAEFLANVGTANVAKDLDMLRAVLGDERLTYIGWSYGTAIGTAYAEQFPDNVRAMILDGAIDPNADPVVADIAQTAGFQQAFDDYSQWCADQESCPLGTDPAKATASLPGSWSGRCSTSHCRWPTVGCSASATPITGTNEALYSASQWESLSSALTDLANGDGAALMGIADSYDGRDDQGHYCQPAGRVRRHRLHRRIEDRCGGSGRRAGDKNSPRRRRSSTGDPPRGVHDPCAFWPATPAEAGSLAQLQRTAAGAGHLHDRTTPQLRTRPG